MSTVRTHGCTVVARGPGGGDSAKEVGLELDHAGDREEHRGIVWHQARGREHEVTTFDEELREGVAQLVGVQLSPRFSLSPRLVLGLALKCWLSLRPLTYYGRLLFRALQRSASTFSAPWSEGS